MKRKRRKLEGDLSFVPKDWGRKKIVDRRKKRRRSLARRKSMNHRPRIYFRWDENPTQPWTTLKASKNSFRIPGGPRCWNFTMGRLFNSWTSPFQIPVENYCCVSMPVPLLSPTDRPRSFPLSTFLLFHSRLVGNWKIQLTALLYSLHAVSINTI